MNYLPQFQVTDCKVRMYPPVPDQRRWDAFAEGESKQGQELQRLQGTYEEECRLYRCLERLKPKHEITVLHGLEYVLSDVKEFGCSNGGEHDFLVVVKGKCLVGFEVSVSRFFQLLSCPVLMTNCNL